MDPMTIDKLIKKYGTDGISAIIEQLIRVHPSSDFFNARYRAMAADLQEALQVHMTLSGPAGDASEVD